MLLSMSDAIVAGMVVAVMATDRICFVSTVMMLPIDVLADPLIVMVLVHGEGMRGKL